jgi:hypothetical protein
VLIESVTSVNADASFTSRLNRATVRIKICMAQRNFESNGFVTVRTSIGVYDIYEKRVVFVQTSACRRSFEAGERWVEGWLMVNDQLCGHWIG